MVKKKLLSMVLALTMVFAMAPLSVGVAFADEENDGEAADNVAEAADNVAEDYVMFSKDDSQLRDDEPPVSDESELYNLWVGGVQVGPSKTSGQGWSYSGTAEKGTLTLNNANIIGEGEGSAIGSGDMDITLKLVGNNVVGDESNYAGITTWSELGTGSLTIEGTGTLTVTGGVFGIETGNAPLTITDSKVLSEGGLYCGIAGEIINIKDSEVTVTGGTRGLVCDKLNLNNTGSGKYVTRVEATAEGGFLEPDSVGDGEVIAKRVEESPAILAYGEFNIKDDLKIVEPAGGVVKKYTVPGPDEQDALTVFDGDKVADYVIIQGEKKEIITTDDPLIASVKAKGKRKLAISWSAMKGAEGYDIFMARCNKGKKIRQVKLVNTVNGNDVNTWVKKKLKKHRSYKIVVKAWTMQGGTKTYIAESPLIHIYTSGGRGKYTNPKSVSVTQTDVTLNKGETFKTEAKIKKVKKSKKLIRLKHCSPLRYMSDNTSVATVDASGVITAVGAGTCKIFVYTSNGLSAPVTVTVR